MKISVLIPCYNVERWIRKCLDSVVNQTYKNIEIVCVNDCSTDKTRDIILEYKKSYPNIILIDNPKNLGISETRNILIKNATGEYLTFLDSDDWFTKRAIDNFKKAIYKNNKPDLIHAKTWVFFDRTKLFFNYSVTNSFNKKTSKLEYLSKNSCYPWGWMAKTSYIKSLKENFHSGHFCFEDIGFVPIVLAKAKTHANINKKILFYRKRKNSIMQKKEPEKKANALLIQLEYLLDSFKKENVVLNEKERKNFEVFLQIPLSVIIWTKGIRRNKQKYYQYIKSFFDLIEKNNYKISWKTKTFIRFVIVSLIKLKLIKYYNYQKKNNEKNI